MTIKILVTFTIWNADSGHFLGVFDGLAQIYYRGT